MTNGKKLRKKKHVQPAEPGLAVPQNGTVSHVQEAASSIEFSRDAKGVGRWTIKLYGERSDMDDVVDQIRALDRRMSRLNEVEE